jgi:alkyl hydroperoxide reductase 1
LSRIKEKGVDIVAFIAYNDAYVMSAWGKANDVQGEDIVRFPSIFSPMLST